MTSEIQVDGFVFFCNADGTLKFCECKDVEVRKRLVRGGATQYVEQCKFCGRAAGNAIAKGSVKCAEFNDFDAELHSRYQRAISRAHQEARIKEKEDWQRKYKAYLSSAEWANKRRAVLKRASGICEGCLKQNAKEVHHLTYANVGDELLFQLVALCESCHEKAHYKNDIEKRKFAGEEKIAPSKRIERQSVAAGALAEFERIPFFEMQAEQKLAYLKVLRDARNET